MPAPKWRNPDGSRMACFAPDCDKPITDSGYCVTHVQRLRKHGDVNTRPKGSQIWLNPDGTRMLCKLDGCERPVKALGYCTTHWAHTRQGREPTLFVRERPECSVEGCDDLNVARGFCSLHYNRNRLWGEPGPPGRLKTPNWVDGDGNRLPCTITGCPRTVQSSGVCMSHYNYFRYYGLTIEQIDSLFHPDVYRCSNSACGATGTLDLDHDHECCPPSGAKERGYKSCGSCIRGWLCRRCNSLLGFVKEDTTILEGLVSYLGKHH